MAFHKTLVVLMIILTMPIALLAQDNMQDVIYLKNGSIYKGMIIEQVPNVSYKIQSKDGNVYAVTIDEVEKITKEAKPQETRRYGYHDWGHSKNDTLVYQPKKRGYFTEVQVLIENVQGGVRWVNGYKFGRKGYLGIGIGVDRVFSNPFNPKVNGLKKKELAGIYLPLYLYHSSDGPSKGRVTAFYAVEAGYAMAFKGMKGKFAQDDYGNRLKGGVIAGAGLGFKLQSKRHKGHLSLLFNVNYKQVKYEYDQLFLSSTGTLLGSVKRKDVGHLIIPGIRLGIGF